MLRYKTKTRPELVALYDIRPGNGVGLILQPRSPHGANRWMNTIGVTLSQTNCCRDTEQEYKSQMSVD